MLVEARIAAGMSQSDLASVLGNNTRVQNFPTEMSSSPNVQNGRQDQAI